MAEYHNVSVRLKDSEYKELLFLHEKFNRMSYGKVALADVIRLAIKDLHLKESKDLNRPVALEEHIKLNKEKERQEKLKAIKKIQPGQQQ